MFYLLYLNDVLEEILGNLLNFRTIQCQTTSYCKYCYGPLEIREPSSFVN
jgi:hypothetical protein